MQDTLVIRGDDGRMHTHDRPVGVFFSSDPQTDTLLPASLLNGFTLEGQPGRLDAQVLFPFFDLTVKALADDADSDNGQTIGERVMSTIAESLAGGPRFERTVAEHLQEVTTFARNKVEYPYNLLRDFDDPQDAASSSAEEQPPGRPLPQRSSLSTKKDEPRMLTHRDGNIVAHRLTTMASLEQIVTEWSQGSLVILVQEVARKVAPARVPNFMVLQLGQWRPDSIGGGMVVVFLQIALDRVTLIDRYTDQHHAPTLTLMHLGPTTLPLQKDDFFDDMAELEEAISTWQIYGAPVVKKMRFWQSHADSHHKGAILALQSIYTDSVDSSTEFRTPVRGLRDGAHFFVDVVIGPGEAIVEISCFHVAGLYGSITIKTTNGTYTVGSRETGTHSKIEIQRQNLFDAMAFAGEIGRDGSITCLKLITVQPHHFGTSCGPKPPVQSVNVEAGNSFHRRPVGSNRPQEEQPALESQRSRSATGEHVKADKARDRPARTNRIRVAPPAGRPRPSSALSGHVCDQEDRDGLQRQRPQSAMARPSVIKAVDVKLGKSGGGVQPVLPLQFEKNLDMSLTQVHQNELQNGARLRVRADDAEVDSLLRTSIDDSTADWKYNIRTAIAHGVITAQTRLVLQVEYCTAARPSSTLRGTTEQYSRVVNELKDKIATCLWEYNATVLDNRKFEFWGENGECATSPILKPRIGSCEIVLSWQHRSSPRSIIIHSKLQSRKWPVAELIAEELRACLPMQYHDIRFLAQSSSQNSFPKGARFIVTVNEGSDPLGLIGKKTTAVADADGVAHISLPVGWYQIRVEHENFFPETFDYKIGTLIRDEYQPFRRVVLHPRCEKDEIKVSLIWNESPADLDLYAVTPHTKIFHQRRHDKESGVTFGDDARKGFGPEIITFKRAGKEQHTKHLRQGRSSSIHIYVHNYSEECELNESGAIVTVMGETGILHQIEVPKVGIGDFWDVCSIEMRHLHITDRNKLVPSEPDFDIIKSESENGEDSVVIKSTSKEMGAATDVTKQDVAQSPVGRSAMFRSVALLHDYHNYNGIR